MVRRRDPRGGRLGRKKEKEVIEGRWSNCQHGSVSIGRPRFRSGGRLRRKKGIEWHRNRPDDADAAQHESHFFIAIEVARQFLEKTRCQCMAKIGPCRIAASLFPLNPVR